MKTRTAPESGTRLCRSNPSYFLRSTVLAAGLSLITTATGMPGQAGDTACFHRSVNGLAKQGGRISAGKVLVLVDSISSDSVYISLAGPSGVVSNAEPLPMNVWKQYHLGQTSFLLKATTNGSGKEAVFSVSF